MNDNEVIKGHRMTDLESNIFHGWQDLNCSTTKKNEKIIEPYINFKNDSKLEVLSCDTDTEPVRGKRAKIMGSQCYDTETKQWVFMELDMTQPIDRYIPEWMFAEWLTR